MRSVIRSIGIELEGGGIEQCVYDVARRFNDIRIDIGSDGSVYVDNPTGECGWNHNLEVRYWVYINELDKLFNFIRVLFEECRFRQNRTCGNHIHVRLSKYAENVVLLFVDRFVKMFRDAYKRYAMSKAPGLRERLMARLNNRYCMLYEDIIDLYSNAMGSGNRYRFVNFLSLYEEQRTIEFRVFPYAETVEEVIDFINFLVRTVNKITRSLITMFRLIEQRPYKVVYAVTTDDVVIEESDSDSVEPTEREEVIG